MENKKRGAYFVRLHKLANEQRVSIGNFLALDAYEALKAACRAYPQLMAQDGWRVEIQRMELP